MAALPKKGYKKNVQVGKPKMTTAGGVKVTGLNVTYSAASGQAIANWGIASAWSTHVDKYEARWDYLVPSTGGNQWILGTTSSTGTTRQSTFSVPDGALRVRCTVEPVSKEDKKYSWQTREKKKYTSGKNKGKEYWQYTQHEKQIKWFKGSAVSASADSAASDVPEAPGTPVLTAGTGTGVDVGVSSEQGNALKIQLALYTDGAWTAHTGGKVLGTYNSGEVKIANAFTAADGHAYRVDAREQNTITGSWSDYSSFSDVWQAPPLAPTGLEVMSISATAFSASWEKAGYSGDGFELRWGRDKDSLTLDELPEGAYSATTDGATAYSASIASGAWYFVVRGTSTDGNGAWSKAIAFTAGLTPAAPTIGELPAYVAQGGNIQLSWTYNNADGSAQTAYEVQASLDGGEWQAVASGTDNTASLTYAVAAKCSTVAFRVRTKGVVSTWSEWAVSGAVAVDPPLTVTLTIGDASRLPLSIGFAADADVRLWHLVVTAKEQYATTGDDGNEEVIPAGAVAFESILSVGDEEFAPRAVDATLDLTTAQMVSGCTYTATLSAISAHGLTDDDVHEFTASWDGSAPIPGAAIPPVDDDLEAHIFPFCYTDTPTGEVDEDGNPTYELADVTLAIYRLDSDGEPLLVSENLPNTGSIEVIDPHPNFGECWYRIAATARDGSMGFYDDVVEVDNGTVVLQFEDGQRSYAAGDYAAGDFDPSGFIELPYNLSIKEQHDPDAELAEFIGNPDPTLYTGTQLGRSASVSGVVLESEDDGIIRRLRWLQGSMARAYYRDPTGLGFWAWVTAQLSFDGEGQPVSVELDVKRIMGEYTGRTV